MCKLPHHDIIQAGNHGPSTIVAIVVQDAYSARPRRGIDDLYLRLVWGQHRAPDHSARPV